MPLAILLDQAHPMSLLPQLEAQVPRLPDSAIDELRKDVSIRLLYLFPENADLSGMRATANGVGQLIDLTSTEAAHLLNEARRLIYKVYIEEMQWKFGENTPSCIQRVKAHSVCGTSPSKKPRTPLNLPMCVEENAIDLSGMGMDGMDLLTMLPPPLEVQEEKTQTLPPPCSPSPISRRVSMSASFSPKMSPAGSLHMPPEMRCSVPPRRPSCLKNSHVVMNGVADKFDAHAIWCLAVVNDERFDTKKQYSALHSRRTPSKKGTVHGNLVILNSRVVGCMRMLVRDNCPDKRLEIEGYLSEERNADLQQRLHNMCASNDPLQRVEYLRLVEMNRLAILKEYRGMSLSDDLLGMICIYASEHGSSVIFSSPYKHGYEKGKRMGKYVVEMGELQYEDHDPYPCSVAVLQLPLLLWLNRAARYLLFVIPRKYWRLIHYPRRLAKWVGIALLLLVLLSLFINYLLF